MRKILITGGAGFIGYHLYKKLENENNITAIDLLSADKYASVIRSKHLSKINKGDIHESFLDTVNPKPELVIHLAAETGIPGSLVSPEKYFKANLEGTFNVLEQCRKNNVSCLIYASSSSVYEPNQPVMCETSLTRNPLSFYGTTKKLCESMVQNYCKQFGIKAIGLRFFTVYGSWTRPDMAAYTFMHNMQLQLPITLYNNGKVFRDFTHVSDIVNAIALLSHKIFSEPKGSHQIFNIGYGLPVSVKDYAEIIAKELKVKPSFIYKNLPENELPSTCSNTQKLTDYIGYKPLCSLTEGVKEMVIWFKKYKYA